MEAIAAAGALPGLASALIQLGTATFQFYQQLHGLYKAIKYGENDLNTAIKRLDQHGDFIKELRFNFRRISNTSVSGGTRDLFERYIAESEAEVEEFRSLLNRVGKHHFKNKSWQAVETGSRLRFNERSIQKYCDLLDKQMQRFLFLQSSVQSMRVESTLSEVMETLVKQGTAAVTFYNEQSSLRQMNREPHSRLGAGSDETRLSLRGVGKSSRTSSLLQEDIIPNDWHIRQVKSYSTLCGTVSVTTFSDSTASEGKKHQFAYRVWFEPYSWISRTAVEWRLLNSTQRAPKLTLSMTTSIICDDPDVLDALGLVACTRSHHSCPPSGCFSWHTKVPSSRKVRALLDTRRLSKDHILDLPGFLNRDDVITAYFKSHRPGHKDGNNIELGFGAWDYHCSESDLDDLSQHYLEYYRVIQILLSYGFQPHLSNWQRIYRLAMRDHYHILKRHPRLISTINLAFKSVPLLILEACGYPIPFNYAITLGHDKIFVTMAQLVPTSYAIDNIWSSRSSVSYLGHLIAMGDSAEKIKEILELGLIDLADEQCMFDRWLLGLFAPFRPEIASLLEQYLESYKTIAFHHSFSVEYIREEFKQPPRESNMNQRQDLLRFICFYGNAAIIQQLDVAALTTIEIAGMQIFAAQGSNREVFDILMSSKSRMLDLRLLPHTQLVRDKLTSEPAFVTSFIKFLEACSDEPLPAILCRMTLNLLLLPNSQQLPDYIRNIIIGQIQRYEASPLATGWEIHSLIHEVMELVWWNEISPQNVTSPPLSHTFGEPPVFPYPSVDGYSALMLALHCGMKPAVQILVDAGASILEPMCCGKSALSVARENTRAQHPRQWAESCDLTGKLFIPSRLRQEREAMWVLESTDKDMLEILLKALRDRGELEGERLDHAPTPSKRGIFTSKVRHFIRWLFKPYVFDANVFRENCIYTLLVSILWFLSVLKVLKVELGDSPSYVCHLLSRPVVVLALIAWVLSSFLQR
ncbi:hypothetical protein F5X98DRAFT_369494 [Xylaria grammica]|nr:hypothetical protein F5X98DRAFT_369494 [Xylaria grammica]